MSCRFTQPHRDELVVGQTSVLQIYGIDEVVLDAEEGVPRILSDLPNKDGGMLTLVLKAIFFFLVLTILCARSPMKLSHES